MNPVVLWRTARAQGVGYLAILAAMLFYAYLLWLALRFDVASLLQLAVALFAWLSTYALIGGSIFEHRHALGYEPIDSPEQRAERAAHELEQTRTRFIDTVYHQARGGNLTDAWHSLEQELAAQQYAPEFSDWLLERLRHMPDLRLADRLAQHECTRALGKDNIRATRVVQEALAADASFRPRSAVETLRCAELLRLSGHRSAARLLLADFAHYFPDPAASARAAQMAQDL